ALAVAEQAATASERAAEQHRRALAAVLARPAGTPFGELTEYAAKTLTRSGERLLTAERHARHADAEANRFAKYARKAAQRLDGMQHRAKQAEADLAAVREGVRACGGDPTHVQNAYAQIRMWRNSAQRADHKAARYRTAWLAARRDRKADRAAMAADLPAVQAGQRALAVADELFVAGRTPAERDAGRRILAAFREMTTRAAVADEYADAYAQHGAQEQHA
ncbi:hypothetical protein ACFVAQ_45870, partial [Streptomyces sp. NPDC057651]